MTCLRCSAFRRNTIFVSQRKVASILHKGSHPNEIKIKNLMISSNYLFTVNIAK